MVYVKRGFRLIGKHTTEILFTVSYFRRNAHNRVFRVFETQEEAKTLIKKLSEANYFTGTIYNRYKWNNEENTYLMEI